MVRQLFGIVPQLAGQACKTRENVSEIKNRGRRRPGESKTFDPGANVVDHAVEYRLFGRAPRQKLVSQQDRGRYGPHEKSGQSPYHGSSRSAREPGEIIDAERCAAGKINNDQISCLHRAIYRNPRTTRGAACSGVSRTSTTP